MFTLVVTNRKGGTAKTTTAVNLAAEFAKQGKKSLLIDLDPQGHSGIGVGFKPINEASSRQSILNNSRQALTRLLHETDINNLFFIPSGQHGSEHKAQADRLAKFLAQKQIHSKFDITVIDTPPNAGLEQTAAILAADGVLIPFMPTPLGKEGVKQLLDDMIDITATTGSQKPGYGLIPIMLDSRVNLDKQVLSDMINIHGMEKILRGVRRNVRLAEAFDAGQPVNVFDARSRGAFDYHMLSQDLQSLWPNLFPKQETLSFRKQAQIKVFPSNKKSATKIETTTHRGIRLKEKCIRWHN